MSTESTVRLRILSRKPPAKFDGRATEFGILDKKKQLHPGKPAGSTRLAFTIEVPVAPSSKRGTPRFKGPFVHSGSGGAQHLYLGWRAAKSTGWINRLKVHLDLSSPQVKKAAAQGAVLEADGTGPEWGVLADWHGLDVGRDWKLKRR